MFSRLVLQVTILTFFQLFVLCFLGLYLISKAFASLKVHTVMITLVKSCIYSYVMYKVSLEVE